MTEAHTPNSTLAIVGVLSPLDAFVVAKSSVFRTNICAEIPAHRQSAIFWRQGLSDSAKPQRTDIKTTRQ
jgi:hypothetical protein